MEPNYIFTESDSMPWQPSEIADGVEVTADIRWPMSVIMPISSALPPGADVAAVGRKSPKLTHRRHSAVC
jgi:hypothetical protein